MKFIQLIIYSIFIYSNALFAQEKVRGKSLVLPQIRVIPINDTQNNRSYELYVELPEGYAESPDKSYPVLFYTDALWHMEILSACSEYLLTDVILVGISWQKDIDAELIEEHGPHVSRYRDYTITESSNPELQSKYQLGQANSHLAFIQKDVVPYIEANYRTDKDNRAYFGYSASGLFGAYVLLTQPATFQHYILGSPSLKGDIPKLEQLESTLKGNEIQANVFISYGTQEDELGGYADQFINLLKERNSEDFNIYHVELEGAHQTAFPMTGVQAAYWLMKLLEN